MTVTNGDFLRLSGILISELRGVRMKRNLYFRLEDGALSSHRRKGHSVNWTVNVVDSTVTESTRTSEVILRLADGRTIRLGASTEKNMKLWSSYLQTASRRKLGLHYSISSVIGSGSYAEVRLGMRKSDGQEMAIKVIRKKLKDKELAMSVQCEIDQYMAGIFHENITRMHDVFNTPEHLFLVMEYVPGGTLFQLLEKEGVLSELEALSVVRGLLRALQHLHAHRFVHRDIKPENVLCSSQTFPMTVKLSDFGLCASIPRDKNINRSLKGMYGTPFFVAPEIVRGEAYGPKVDIWSTGVMLYNLISGRLPFSGGNMKEVVKTIQNEELKFPDETFKFVSNEAKDLISLLLQRDPEQRPTAEEALEHAWFCMNPARRKSDVQCSEEKLDNVEERSSKPLFEFRCSFDDSSMNLLKTPTGEAWSDTRSDDDDVIEGVEDLHRSATLRAKQQQFSTRTESSILPKLSFRRLPTNLGPRTLSGLLTFKRPR